MERNVKSPVIVHGVDISCQQRMPSSTSTIHGVIHSATNATLVP